MRNKSTYDLLHDIITDAVSIIEGLINFCIGLDPLRLPGLPENLGILQNYKPTALTKSFIFHLRSLCVLLFLSLFFSATAQNKDSLLRLVPSAKDTKERIRLLYLIIDNAGDNDPDKTLYYHKKLLALSQKANDKAVEAMVQSEIGWSLSMMGNRVAGSELMLKGARMADKTGNQQAIGFTAGNLANIYDDPQKQKELMFKGLNAATAAKDYRIICLSFYSLELFYYDQKQYDSAMHYAQQMLSIAMAQNIEELKPTALIRMGWHSYRIGQKGVALEYFQAARRDPYTAKDPRTLMESYGTFGGYYGREGKADSVLYYAQLAYAATVNTYYSTQAAATNMLWRSYEGAGITDSAFKYMKMYTVMKDSMQSIDKAKQVQAQILVDEVAQQKLSEERNNTIQYSAIALGVVALLIGFLVLSHSVLANQRLIRFLGIISLLIVFEFLNLLLHPWLGSVTHHSPVLMLLAMVCLAALLIPLHHKLEHWITHKMVEKNNKIRLAAAKRTIAILEGEQTKAS